MFSRLQIRLIPVSNNSTINRLYATSKPQGKWRDGYFDKKVVEDGLSDVKEGFAKQGIRDMFQHRVSVAPIEGDKVVIANNTTSKIQTKIFIDDQGSKIVIKNKSLGYSVENGKFQYQHTGQEVVISQRRFQKLSILYARKNIVDIGTLNKDGIQYKTGKEIEDQFNKDKSIVLHEVYDNGNIITTVDPVATDGDIIY